MKRYPHERETKETHHRPDGYWPSADYALLGEMSNYLRKRDLSFVQARECKWYPSSDAGDSKPRIVIPAIMSRRSGIYWQARATDESEPRYQSPYVDREDALVILSHYISPRRLAITEGPMDALAAFPYVDISIALMGNSPSERVWRYLLDLCSLWTRRGLEKITLIGDLDAADAPARWMIMLSEFKPYVVFPNEKDLAACTWDERKELLR